MKTLRAGLARLGGLFHRDSRDRDLSEELAGHVALHMDDNLRRGMTPEEARRDARIRLGGVESVKENVREQRGFPVIDSFLRDVRYSLRGLRRDRAFTLTAIAMLALAIGLNVTVFAVMNTMLFRGFPLVQRNDRLLYMQEQYRSGSGSIAYLDFEDWRAQAHSFEGMTFVAEKSISVTYGEGHSVDASAFTVSTNAFGLLRVKPALGRDFVPADEASGAAPVVILNHRFWESRFGGRRDVVGASVLVDKAPATVIGVMPEGFDFPTQFDVWMPYMRSPEAQQRGPTSGAFLAFGRLRDGANVPEARAELEAINLRLGAAYPATNRGVVPSLATYSQSFIGPDAPIIYGSLWAAAWFVLLIACANLANLTVARTVGRRSDFSTRIALGAGRGRMMRQIFVESLTLTSVAGVLGWWIAKWGVRTWAVETASIYQILDYTLDAGTLAYLVAISLAAAILFALAPMGRVLQIGVNSSLKSDAPGVTQGLRGKHLAAVLVAGQMALAIVLLSGAGVLVRSLMNVAGANTGVRDPENVLVGVLSLPSEKYPSPAISLGYVDRFEAKVRAIPGIKDESVASRFPVYGVNPRTFEIEGRPNPPEGGEAVQFLSVGSDYFRVLGASAISGREFNDRDRTVSLPVAIVNQSFAARYSPREQALGRRLRSADRNKPSEWLTVVGVVPNIMQGDPTRRQFKPLVYLPFRQAPTPRAVYFLLRTGVPPGRVAKDVRAEIGKLDPDVILKKFTTLKASLAFDPDQMDRAHSEMGKYAGVAPIFALMALLLAAVGLYAVIAHSVSQRTKEIGVRQAIGATAEQVRTMILREGMLPVAIGLVVGLGSSFAVNRILQSQLVGVSPYDVATMTAAPVILIVVAFLACRIPARRAMRTVPAIALRYE
jgi:putative ABC transport system permease protein